MEKHIILCDHDLEWAGRFGAEFTELDICIRYIEALEDVINEEGNFVIVCSQYIIEEYILEYGWEAVYTIIQNRKFNIFIITDTYSYNDEFRLLKAGCIDYQSRSVPIEIIVQRVKNIIIKKLEDRILHEESGVIYAGGNVLKLTKKESEVLSYLLVHRDEIVSKATLMKELWNMTNNYKSRAADTIIKQLRKKLKGYDAKIITYYGGGILLKSG